MRHHAVGAGVVAAFDDGDVGADGIVAAGDFGLECLVGIEIEAHHAAAAGFEFVHQLRKLPVACRAAHQADPRRALENFFAFLLRDASEHADDFAGVSRGRAPFAEARKNFLRGFFANAAGVVEDQIGLRRASARRGSRGAMSTPETFSESCDVHLAAEGFDEERLGGRGAWVLGCELRIGVPRVLLRDVAAAVGVGTGAGVGERV